MDTTDALQVLGLADHGDRDRACRNDVSGSRVQPDQLRAAFRSACLRTHPDKTGEAGDAAAFARVLDAYRALRDLASDEDAACGPSCSAKPNPRADAEWSRLGDAFLASLLRWMNHKRKQQQEQAPVPKAVPMRVCIDVGVLDAYCGAFMRVVLRRQQDRHELFVRVETERGTPNLMRLAYRFAAGPAVGPSDVSVRVRLQPQGGFAWRPPGPDLELVHAVPLDTWMTGEDVEVPMPDGSTVASVPNFRDGSRHHIIPGAGLPIGASNGCRLRGSLFVRVVPALPPSRACDDAAASGSKKMECCP